MAWSRAKRQFLPTSKLWAPVLVDRGAADRVRSKAGQDGERERGGGRGSAVGDVSVSPSIHGLQHSKSFGDSFGPTTHDNAVLALRMQAAVHRDMTWQRRIFGIGPKQLHLPRSRMIHPSSPFAQGIAITSSLLLVYSAIVTPVLIGFFTNQPECLQHDTLVIDMFADVFFLLEILVALCTGATVDGEYCDEWRRVWWRYLTTNLLFDCCTSIPVAWIEWAGLQQCRSLDIDIQDGHDTKGGSQALKVVRIVKPLRLFKLLRVLKAMKILQLLDDLESYLRLPPFMFRMVRVLIIILYAVHVTSCTFWLVKENTNGEEEVREWFAALLDHPDEDSDSLYHKYVVSFYFINTIFSTVGFGDIVPGNSPERLFVVGAFYLVGVCMCECRACRLESPMKVLASGHALNHPALRRALLSLGRSCQKWRTLWHN